MRLLPAETETVRRAFREAFADNIIVPQDGPCVQRPYRMTWGFYLLDHGFALLKKELGNTKFFVRCEPEVREETYVPIAEFMHPHPHTEFTERVILFRLAFPWKE